MKNKQLREIVTRIFTATDNKVELETCGMILTEYLRRNPDKETKVKKMIAGLEVRLEKFIEQENNKHAII